MKRLSILIADLDNTLFDPRTIPAAIMAPVHAALRAANVGPDSVSPATLDAAIAQSGWQAFDWVAQQIALPDALVRAWHDAHGRTVVRGLLTPFPDIGVLGELPLSRILVTTGFRAFQESKITALRLGTIFEEVVIDALDDPKRAGKRLQFERIARERNVHASEVLVLGDSAEAELAAGSQLGMVTVQILRPGVRASSAVDYRIASLSELPNLLETVNRARAV